MKLIFKTYDINKTLQEVWKNRASYNIRSFKELVAHLRESSDHIRDIFDRELSGFVVHIVLNKVRTTKDALIGENLKSVCMNFLGLPVVFAGYCRQDEAVHNSINNRAPLLISNRISPAVKEIKTLTENIITGTHLSVRKELGNGSTLKYYDLLELSPEATIEEIQKSYSNLKTLYSRDLIEITALNTDTSQELQQDYLSRLDEAYEKLKLLHDEKRPAITRITVIMDEGLSEWIKGIDCFTGVALRSIRERMGVDLKEISAALS